MSNKMRRYALLVFAALVGLVMGYLRPEVSQSLLSVVGIIVGLGYLILSRREETNKTTQKKKNSSPNQIDWYLLLQMLLYFIVGAALGATIVYIRVLY
ncbi:hypothetical protein LMF32_02865 [Desemzia sp. C1]|uniref:hypothetical protein n=1 Tax=Desemzia TaxID=82800 RepID=UPI0016612E87|nr:MULTISPECIES: hypothetical protein [Desemzia]MCI3028071.1 hypothetical protein [Desemzia sp. C1]